MAPSFQNGNSSNYSLHCKWVQKRREKSLQLRDSLRCFSTLSLHNSWQKLISTWGSFFSQQRPFKTSVQRSDVGAAPDKHGVPQFNSALVTMFMISNKKSRNCIRLCHYTYICPHVSSVAKNCKNSRPDKRGWYSYMTKTWGTTIPLFRNLDNSTTTTSSERQATVWADDGSNEGRNEQKIQQKNLA